MNVNNPLSAEVLTNLFRTSPKDPDRIINREGITIEFKESYNHAGMAQYFKTIASFANNAGGYIIFGIGDKPRTLLGLKDNNLKKFEDLNVEIFTKNLLEYFSPEIKWDHCTFEFKGLSFGVIYTFPLENKPCICRKNAEEQNQKYSLKEGDIYYRYGGRSERIRYTELNKIIENSRKNEEHKWLDFAKRAVKIGVDNACLLDLNSGVMSGQGGSVIIDEKLLEKLSFIREGEFVEVKGKPTLRLIGDVIGAESGKLVVGENTRKVVRAIETADIVRAFLKQEIVDEPLEFLKTITSESSANLPFYFLIEQANIEISDAIKVVEETKSRSNAKKYLLKRLKGKYIDSKQIANTQSKAAEKKREYREQWVNENIIIKKDECKYCVDSILSLAKNEIENHFRYISKKLLSIFESQYEDASPALAQSIRNAICYLDEKIYLVNE